MITINNNKQPKNQKQIIHESNKLYMLQNRRKNHK